MALIASRLLESALDAIEEHVFVLDRDGRNVFGNLAGARAFGRGRSEILGLTWRQIIKQTDRVDAFERLLEEVFETGRQRGDTYAVSGAAGLRDHRFTLTPIFADDGRTVEYVIAVATDVTGTQPEPGARDLLTERERMIVALMVKGHSNQEIAESLVVSRRTIETHRRNIGKKLGATTRAQIFDYARRHGLT